MEDNKKELEEITENKETTVDEKEQLESNENKEINEEEENKPLEPMDSICECDFNFEYKSLKYYNMFYIKAKRHSGVIFLVFSILCFGVGIAYLINAILKGNPLFTPILLIIVGFFPLYNLFTEEANVDKSLERFFAVNKPFVEHLSFNREKIRIGVEVEGKYKEVDYDWGCITEIDIIPEYYFIFINGKTPIIIERNQEIFNKGTLEDLTQILKEQSAMKPTKFYNKPLVKKLININYPVDTVNNEVKEEIIKEEVKEEVVEKEETTSEDVSNDKVELKALEETKVISSYKKKKYSELTNEELTLKFTKELEDELNKK